MRAIRLVREEQDRLANRGPSFHDPLGMTREGIMMPAANATRRWQPPKFSACVGVEADASMELGAFEEGLVIVRAIRGSEEAGGLHKMACTRPLPVPAREFAHSLSERA